MFKLINYNEEVLLNYLNSFDTIYQKRNNFLNYFLEINNDNYKWNFISSGPILGQLFEEKYDSFISLKKVSHIIKKVKKINGEYFGEIEVLNTDYGKVLSNIINLKMNLYLECIYHISDPNKILRIDIKS